MKIAPGDIVKFRSQFNNQQNKRLGMVIQQSVVGRGVFIFYLIMNKAGETEWVKADRVERVKTPN
tara:strand:- start:272 stop:466 length:195 start_codon:yes stop_codon:yes gene_type:complete